MRQLHNLLPKLIIFNACKMSTEKTITKKVSKDVVCEEMSIRALKRIRAKAHYAKKHQANKVKPLENETRDQFEDMYYFENGLRKVYPYYYNFSTFVKGRWIGQTVIDVLEREFTALTREEYEAEIANGGLTVNGKVVSSDFRLDNNQFLQHRCHRHETPVLDTPIEIIEDTPELLVINKPASIPCHPCGSYRYNSLTFILEREYGYKNIRNLYRLDRLTSGVLMMPKTTSLSVKLERQLAERKFEKHYLCRVVGKFPDGTIDCNEPIGVLSHKMSIYGIVPDGKPSSTTFTRISYNGKTSVVKCHPIVNDPVYNNSKAFGQGKGKDGVIELPIDEMEQHLRDSYNIGCWKRSENPRYLAKLAEKEAGKCDKIHNHSLDSNVDFHDICNTECDEKNKVVDTGPVVKSDDENLVTPSQEVKFEGTDNALSNKHVDIDRKADAEIIDAELAKEKRTEYELIGESEEEIKQNAEGLLKEHNLPPAKRIKLADNTIPTSEVLNQVETACASNIDTSKPTDIDNNVNNSNMKISALNNRRYDMTKDIVDINCRSCKFLYEDPKKSDCELYLHAVMYKGPEFEYSAPIPYWATEDWQDDDNVNL